MRKMNDKFTNSSAEYIKKYKNVQKETSPQFVKTLSNNVISLKDLTDGTWLWRTIQKEHIKTNKRCKNKILKTGKQENKMLTEEKMFQITEAEIPKSLEEKIDDILKESNKKPEELIKGKIHSKPIYFKNYCMNDNDLNYYDNTYFEAAKERISDRLRKLEDFDELIMELQLEIIDTYKQFLIKPLRQEYPILIIRAPVPWHQSKLMAGHFMHYNLFIGNEILRNIQSLYFTKYYDVTIVKLEDLGTIPISANEIQPKMNLLCNKAIDQLVKYWLADVAEFFLEKKYAWSRFIEKHYDASISLIEKYFRSVNTLLSLQLRMMVMKTLNNIRDFFMEYSNGNYFEGDFKDLMFYKTPFITITVEPELGTIKLNCKPSILEVRAIISECFDKVIEVGTMIPKIETILFPELKKQEFLSSVSRYEESVKEML